MKKIFFVLVLLASFSFAYSQTEVCEAQCQAWKFVWQDDYSFDYLVTMCAKDPGDVGMEMVGFWADMVTQSIGLQTFMEAYICADVATTYIHPQIEACGATCAQDSLFYAPNLYLDDYSVYYSESNRQINVRVRNNGRAYLPASYAEVYAGESGNASIPASMRLLKNASVPGIRPQNVRYLPEGFENAEYAFTVAYTPAADKYNVVRVLVHTDPRYAEMGTRDNKYELVINDLPLPADLRMEEAGFSRHEQETDIFIVHATITNEGELPADAEVRYYFGAPIHGDLAASEAIRVAAGGEAYSEQPITFTPGKSSYITIQVFSEGNVAAERTLYLNPVFFYVYGKVTDEEGRAIPGAAVKVGTFSNTDFPLTTGGQMITMSDDSGNYEFASPFSEERTITVSAQKNGYFANSTTATFVYNGTGTIWLQERRIRADISLTQHPIEVGIDYPARGRYIIETDKGRFTGEYTPGVPIPVRGSNGTIFVSSPLCSFFAGKFSTTYQSGYFENRPEVKCLSPDTNDDYSLLQEKQLLWEKEYSGEEPRAAYFSRRGDHAYVLTADTSTNFCSLYAYDLVGGNQLFAFRSNAPCAQKSMVSPSYDGSQAYFGVPAIGNPRRDGTPARGYILSNTGAVMRSWEFNTNTESLAHSSAAAMAELVQDPSRFYAPGNLTLENCNLVLDDACNGGGAHSSIESLGLSRNRAIGDCGENFCVFTPAYNDTIMLDRHYTNPIGSGNYANPDVFIADYRNGSYFRGGEILWGVEEKVERASISPGGRYVALAYDPYKIEIFSAEGQSLLSSGDHATGMEATERGIFYATHQGNRIKFYRLSTMVEPSSTTTSGGGALHTGFVGQLWQALVDFYNWLVQSLFPSG